MKYEVIWSGPKNGRNVKEHHGIFNTEDEAFESIRAWWKKNDFTPPYIKLARHEKETVVDYGSHICFYIIKQVEDTIKKK